MTLPKDKEPDTPKAPAGEEPAGRVEFDSRGNSVWRWAREVLDSTSILLKRLENKDLAIEPTRKVRAMGAGKAAKKSSRLSAADLSVSGDDGGRDSGGGFDPYNSRR